MTAVTREPKETEGCLIVDAIGCLLCGRFSPFSFQIKLYFVQVSTFLRITLSLGSGGYRH